MFGAFKWPTNPAPDKYSYSGYGTGFDSCSLFLFPDFDCGENDATFGEDNSSSVHIDKKKKDILVLAEGPNTRIRWYHNNDRRQILY